MTNSPCKQSDPPGDPHAIPHMESRIRENAGTRKRSGSREKPGRGTLDSPAAKIGASRTHGLRTSTERRFDRLDSTARACRRVSDAPQTLEPAYTGPVAIAGHGS